MHFDSLYKDAIDARFKELMEKKLVKTYKGIDLFETDKIHHERIREKYWNLLKENGKDTVFSFFLCTLENEIDSGLNLPVEVVFEYALDCFKERQYKRREIWPELKDWFKLTKEDVEKVYIEYKACDKALDEIYSKNPKGSIEVIIPFDNINSDNESNISDEIGTSYNDPNDSDEIEASYMSILNKNKRIIIDKLYDFLNSYYIDTIDEKIFEDHFNGKLLEEKINFKRDLYLLIKLLDGLADIFENGFRSKVYRTARYECISTHFVYNNKIISKSNWEKARARYKDVSGIHDKEINQIEKFIKTINTLSCPS